MVMDAIIETTSHEGVDESNNTKCTNLNHQYKDLNLEDLKVKLTCDDVSKNQKKKIMKQIKWLESADRRKELRKKRKLRYKENRLKNVDAGQQKRKKIEQIATTEDFDSHRHIAIDLSFNELMNNKDIRKLGKQLGWCYQVNRRAAHPVQYHLCGLKDRLKTAVDPSHVNWDIHFDNDLFNNVYVNNIIYLTAESPDVLTKFEPGKIYVIGGLVDHNHQKGICQKLAESKNVATARLPLQENIDIKTRKVLAINHVFEIMLAFAELQDWKSAILKVLPQKKLNVKSKLSDSMAADENSNHPNDDQPTLPTSHSKDSIKNPDTFPDQSEDLIKHPDTSFSHSTHCQL